MTSPEADIRKRLEPDKGKSNAGFYWGVAGSTALFALQMAANGNASLQSSAMVASAVQGIDGSAYAVVARAAKHEKRDSLRRALQYRRVAAGVICLAALVVGGKATSDLIGGNFDRPAPEAALIVAAAGVANAAISRKLLPDADPGTAHRDAWRHAAVDAAGSFVVAGSIVAASLGAGGADQAAAALTSGFVILANLPTKSRLGIDTPMVTPQATLIG